MKNLKKTLALLIALTMILSLAAPGFAATPTDVVGTEYESAVGKLVALGVLEGYEDGTFKPDQDITRAEFAKIAVEILGLGTAAESAKGATEFDDVSSNHWASGYINVAKDRGLIKGKGNGNFAPSDKISYSEAITILVRALGLGPVVEQQGTWPTNYLAQAAETGITSGFNNLSGDANAVRGNLAKMAWKTLKSDKWGATGHDGTGSSVEYGSLNKSLLEHVFSDYVDGSGDAKVYEEATVTSTFLTNASNDEGKITYSHADATAAGVDTSNVEVTFDGVDVNSLSGKEVTLMVGEDDKVVYVEVTSDSAEGMVDTFYTSPSDDDEIELTDGSKYAVKTGASFMVNAQAQASYAAAVTAVGDHKAYLQATLNDDGLITSANISVANTDAGLNTTQFVVEEVNEDNGVVNLETGSAVFDIDDFTADNATKDIIVVKNGAAATVDDIEAGDVASYVVVRGTLSYLSLTDNKVTGSVSGLKAVSNGAGNATRYEVTVDGTTYTMPYDGSTVMTSTGSLDDVEAVSSDLVDFLGQDTTLYLNGLGELVVAVTEVTSAESFYGLVSDSVENNLTNKAFEVLTESGEKVVYTVKGDEFKTVTTSTLPSAETEAFSTLAQYDFVQYKIDSDGKVSAENIVEFDQTSDVSDSNESVYAKAVSSLAYAALNDDAKSITTGGTTYYVNSDTVVYNKDASNLELVDGWAAMVGSTAGTSVLDGTDVFFVYNNDTKIIEHMVVDLASYATSDDKYAIYKADPTVVNGDGDEEITVYLEGSDVTYTVNQRAYDSTVASTGYVEAGDLVKYSLVDGEFDGDESAAKIMVDASDVADTAADANTVNSVSVADRLISKEAGGSVKLDSDAVIYDVTDTANPVVVTLSDMTAGMVFDAIDTDSDTLYDIVVIVD